MPLGGSFVNGLMAFGAIATGFAFLIVGGNDLRRDWRFREQGRRAMGTVTELKQSSRGFMEGRRTGTRARYRRVVSYRYTDHHGQTHYAQQTVNHFQQKPGDSLMMEYLENQPRTSRIVRSSVVPQWLGYGLSGGLGLGLLGWGVVSAVNRRGRPLGSHSTPRQGFDLTSLKPAGPIDRR